MNIIDDHNRESIWIEVGLSIGAKHMTDLLEWIVKERGKPKAIRTDNGPEFTSSFLRIGVINTELKSGISNRENLSRMLLLKDSTEVTEPRF